MHTGKPIQKSYPVDSFSIGKCIPEDKWPCCTGGENYFSAGRPALNGTCDKLNDQAIVIRCIGDQNIANNPSCNGIKYKIYPITIIFYLLKISYTSTVIHNLNFTIGPRHLVLTDSGVVGEYLDLEKAKQKLMSIADGNRIIANVNTKGVLKNNPKIIENTLQELGIQPIQEDKMYKLLSFGEEYINSLKGKFTSVFSFVPKIRII